MWGRTKFFIQWDENIRKIFILGHFLVGQNSCGSGPYALLVKARIQNREESDHQPTLKIYVFANGTNPHKFCASKTSLYTVCYFKIFS